MKPTLPRAGTVEAKVALSRTSGSVLITPMQFGPDHAHAVASRACAASCCSSAAPAAPTSLKPAVITTTPAHALAPALVDRRAAPSRAAPTMTARSTGSGISADAAVGLHRVHDRRVGIDRVDRPGELEVDQVAQDLVADAQPAPGRADDGHRARAQNRIECVFRPAAGSSRRNGLPGGANRSCSTTTSPVPRWFVESAGYHPGRAVA